MFPHEVPTKLGQWPTLYGVPLRALPWLGLGLVVFGLVAWHSSGLVATLAADRWTALGLRLALGLAAALPAVALAAPGVVHGHSLPGLLWVALRWTATPHLALWRPVPPCVPTLPDPQGHGAAVDTWGSDREEW